MLCNKYSTQSNKSPVWWDGCWDKIKDRNRKCAGVIVCVQYHMKHTGWRGRPLLQCMLCEVSSVHLNTQSTAASSCEGVGGTSMIEPIMEVGWKYNFTMLWSIISFLFPRFIASSSSPRSAKSWSLQMLLCIQSVELWLIIVAVILSNKH